MFAEEFWKRYLKFLLLNFLFLLKVKTNIFSGKYGMTYVRVEAGVGAVP
jgi:hypothetical protein